MNHRPFVPCRPEIDLPIVNVLVAAAQRTPCDSVSVYFSVFRGVKLSFFLSCTRSGFFDALENL